MRKVLLALAAIIVFGSNAGAKEITVKVAPKCVGCDTVSVKCWDGSWLSRTIDPGLSSKEVQAIKKDLRAKCPQRVKRRHYHKPRPPKVAGCPRTIQFHVWNWDRIPGRLKAAAAGLHGRELRKRYFNTRPAVSRTLGSQLRSAEVAGSRFRLRRPIKLTVWGDGWLPRRTFTVAGRTTIRLPAPIAGDIDYLAHGAFNPPRGRGRAHKRPLRRHYDVRGGCTGHIHVFY